MRKDFNRRGYFISYILERKRGQAEMVLIKGEIIRHGTGLEET